MDRPPLDHDASNKADKPMTCENARTDGSKPFTRAHSHTLEQCFEHLDDRIGQLFDIVRTHIWADIKMHCAAQEF